MDQLIVADAGPLIALSFVDRLGLLPAMFSEVVVPGAVEMECLLRPDKPGAAKIDEAFAKGWLTHQPKRPTLTGIRIATLDEGESAAIELAGLLGAPLLIDERRGRTVAKGKGIRVYGTLGILISARRRSLIPALAPILRQMMIRGFNIFDNLLRAALSSGAPYGF